MATNGTIKIDIDEESYNEAREKLFALYGLQNLVFSKSEANAWVIIAFMVGLIIGYAMAGGLR